MLSLTKKMDYALIALGYLAERPDQTISAREIAASFDMPAALVMNILKTLHHSGLLLSTRGTKGGYMLSADLAKITMYQLIEVLEGPVRLAECVVVETECEETMGLCKIGRACPIQGPIKALHSRLVQFLREVRLAEILPRACAQHHELLGLSAPTALRT